MKYLMILVFGSYLGQPPQQKHDYPKPPVLEYYLTSKEKVRYAFFRYDLKRDDFIGFDKHSKSFVLSQNELKKIEKLIKTRVAVYNSYTRKKFGEGELIKQPEKYFKQIIPVINPSGEKQVWVQCLCGVERDEWKKRVARVFDGGKCIFQVLINLSKGTIETFGTNGLA